MTSTTSERIRRWSNLLFLLPALMAIFMISCEEDKVVTHGELDAALKAQKTSTQAEPQEQPKSPPTGNTAPADKSDEPKREAPYFGSTYWDELLTSVYYYPSTGANDPAMTHLKFNHRDDEIWLCGDQRKSFEPGNRYRLTVTFEPNAPCITNWRVK